MIWKLFNGMGIIIKWLKILLIEDNVEINNIGNVFKFLREIG